MKVVFLIILLVCVYSSCLALFYRKPTSIAFSEHTITTYAKIGNSTSVDAVFNAGEQIPAIKLSVDKAMRILAADAEDGMLAAHAVEQIATLSSPHMVSPIHQDCNIEDRRFEQLTECVDLCVTALPISDLARYVWGMAVVGSNDVEKYDKVIREYALRLQICLERKSGTSKLLQPPSNDSSICLSSREEGLTTADIATMIWTTGCVYDVAGHSNFTFIREAAVELSERLQSSSLNDEVTNNWTQCEALSSKLALRTIWSLAMHKVHLQPLFQQCMGVIFPTDAMPSALTVRSSLSLLWCMTEFNYFETSKSTKLLDAILTYLQHDFNADSTDQVANYQREVGWQVVQLFSSLLSLQDSCCDMIMSEDHSFTPTELKKASYGMLQRIQAIFNITASRMLPQDLLDAPLQSTIVILQAVSTFDCAASVKFHLLEACLLKIKQCLEQDNIGGTDACALLQAMCTVPVLPDVLPLEAHLATATSIADAGSQDSDKLSTTECNPFRRISERLALSPLCRSTKWLRVTGRLAVKATQHCTENAHDSTLLIHTAYAISQLGCSFQPPLLVDSLITTVPLSRMSELSADMAARLLVTLHRSTATTRLSRCGHHESCLHANQVAQHVRTKVSEIGNPLLQAQAIEALSFYSSGDSDNACSPIPSAGAGAVAAPTVEGAGFASTLSENPVSPLLAPLPTGPAGELINKDGTNTFSFEEEEGVVTNTNRLAALVRAAAAGGGGGDGGEGGEGSSHDNSPQVTPMANSPLPVSPPSPSFTPAPSPTPVSAPTPSLKVPQDEPSGEFPVYPLLSPQPEGAYVMSFEEEEGLVTDSERLAALVRAAAAGNLNNNNNAHGGSSSAETPMIPLSPTTPGSPQPEVPPDHESEGRYPVSPLLAPLPTGPAGELINKDGTSTFSFEEEEGVVTNTDRLDALVRAAADGAGSGDGGGDGGAQSMDAAATATSTATNSGAGPFRSPTTVDDAVPKLPVFPSTRLKYLSVPSLARLHRSYTRSSGSNSTSSSVTAAAVAIREEIAHRADLHCTAGTGGIEDTAEGAETLAESILMLLEDLNCIGPPSSVPAGLDTPSLFTLLLNHLDSLIPSMSTTAAAPSSAAHKYEQTVVVNADLADTTAQLRSLQFLVETLKIAIFCQHSLGDEKVFQKLTNICERFLQQADLHPTKDKETAFSLGVLEETLSKYNRQYSTSVQSGTRNRRLPSPLSFGKKLLTQFFRTFVH